MTKNFASKLLSQGSTKLDNLSKNARNFFLWGNLIKESISALNVSTVLDEKSTIYDLLFLITIWPPKIDNKHPFKTSILTKDLKC